MATADDDFHDFVVGFADPLTRLAFLLTAGVASSPNSDDAARAEQLATAALAQTRRHWRDAAATGAPEPLAVEALLSRLPHAHHQPAATHHQPPAETPQPVAEETATDEEQQPVDVQLLRDAAWSAWQTLGAKERVPLVFADVSVASRRLAGLDIPESFGSARKQETLATQAFVQLRAAMARDALAGPEIGAMTGDEFGELLADTLRERALLASSPTDPYPPVAGEVGRARRRVGAGVLAVVVLLVAGSVVAANAATSKSQSAAGASPAATLTVVPVPARTSARSAVLDAGLVVDWPARGGLGSDTALSANLRTAFVAQHPDAVGQVQILVATDTPWFRVAYVTARSRSGILQSWFYGPVGSDALTEGNFSYGGNLLHESVLAAVLSDPAGHSVLVVIGPPETTAVQLTDLDFSKSGGIDVASVQQQNGIAVRDVTGRYIPALSLKVTEGSYIGWNGDVPSIQLTTSVRGGPSGGTSSTPGVASGPDLPPIPVQRGKPDPELLQYALEVELAWARTGELSAGGQAVVLWGGTDSDGTKLVVVRVRTLHLADLVIVVWSGGGLSDGEYLLAPDAPDYPIGFAYASNKGAHVGVLAPPGVSAAELVVDGVPTGAEPVDATGFASMAVTGQYGTLAEQTFVVRMYDSSHRQVTTAQVPPRV